MKNKKLNLVFLGYFIFILLFTVLNIISSKENINYIFFFGILYFIISYILFYPIYIIILNLKIRNKKWLLGLILLIIEIFVFLLINYFEKTTFQEFLISKTGLNIYNSKIIEEKRENGFFGDGYYYVKIDCNTENDKILKQISNWNKLPLTKNLELLLYGSNDYNYNLAYNISLGRIENGYYYFINNNTHAINRYDDKDLFELSSFDFIIVIYDLKDKVLYYYEYNT